MDYLIVGTYDQTAYYETRLVLMLTGIILALHQLIRRREPRYLVVFLSSTLLMAATEYLFQREGLRGHGYSISLLGRPVSATYGPLLQGLLDGGVYGMIALWFADLRTSRNLGRSWIQLVTLLITVLSLAVIIGRLSADHVPTSIQPVFAITPIVIITTMIFFSLLVAWRRDAVATVANFYAGLLIVALLNLFPLHLSGARYVGQVVGAETVRADLTLQAGIGLLVAIFEVAGGKLHFLTIPLSLGLIRIRERAGAEAERLSYQHLQSLTNRGWRKRSKPFKRNSD